MCDLTLQAKLRSKLQLPYPPPAGKYGCMQRGLLKNRRLILYNELIVAGKLIPICGKLTQRLKHA